MTRTRAILAAVLLAAFLAVSSTATAAVGRAAGGEQTPPPIHLFYLDTCPHCAAEKAFLAELVEDFPDLEIRRYEVSSSAENVSRFESMAADHDIEARSVPTTFFGERVWVGFDDRVGEQIRTAVASAFDETDGTPSPADDEPVAESVVDVPILGDVDVGSRSLLVATAVIGFVDGVNPCSLWALTVLLALVLHSGSRRRVFAVGATFLTITTALYGLYIVGIYTLLAYAAYLVWIQRGVAAVAGGLGAVNLKDYFAYGRGPSLSIPDRKKPRIYERARQLASDERSLAAILGGTAALAVGVSLAETPCTAGLPVLWTNMLAARDVATATAVPLFALYMVLFLVDELAVFALAVVTMRVAKLQERHGRTLKLVTGSMMVTLALAMLFDPDRLDTVTGTVQVLAAAAALAALLAGVGYLVQRVRRPPTTPPILVTREPPRYSSDRNRRPTGIAVSPAGASRSPRRSRGRVARSRRGGSRSSGRRR